MIAASGARASFGVRAVACALFAIFCNCVAIACELPGATVVDSPRYTLAWRIAPGEPQVGRHFSIDLAICSKAGIKPPDSVRVDAHMPEHRHGMNYRAVVVEQGQGHYRAEGLMFHMPGRWELLFDLRGGGRTDRITSNVALD